MEVLDPSARVRVLGDPDMLDMDMIFSCLDPPSVESVRLVST